VEPHSQGAFARDEPFMMRSLCIVMPMAGEGSRFVADGYTEPKPLIRAEGRPLFLRALKSLDGIEAPLRHSFIVRREHVDKHRIDIALLECCPNARIFTVNQTTRGAVETCLMAREAISPDDGVLVLDCDLEFFSSAFNRAVREVLEQPADAARGGVLLSFDADNPRYSYALTDGKGRVIRTAEKKVISNNALAGAYFFSSGRSFLTSAQRLLEDHARQTPELYVSLLYNYLIEVGEPVRLVKTDEYRSFGTPEELRHYAKCDLSDPN